MMMMQIILLVIESVLVSSYQLNSTVRCKTDEMKKWKVRAGESMYLCPFATCNYGTENNTYFWFRNLNTTMKLEQIGTEESERVHYHQSTLYIFDLTLNDTGRYIIRWWSAEGTCSESKAEIVVYEEFSRDLLYKRPPEQKVSEISCLICLNQGSFIWYKDFSLIPNQESSRVLRIHNSSKESEGIYTCVCTWEHYGIKHNSSMSQKLIIIDQTISIDPKFQLPINNSIVYTNVGAKVVLNCSVLFGSTVGSDCSVYWEKNGMVLKEMIGYEQKDSQKEGIAQSVLIITAVSELDLQSEFHCKAEDMYEIISVSVTLKREPSMLPVIMVFVFIFSLLLVFSGIVRWFALDLVLFVRRVFIKFYRTEDGKVYDAYVIYQRNSFDEATGRTVSEFVNGALLTVLESSCGYKLFIHGRDDLPGEDSANLIQSQIQLSRRLLIILAEGGGSDSAEAYDLQVGLHQALVQGETPVIIIQLGLLQDYSHLPLGLQHLLRKSSALLWRDGEVSPSSVFWKRVRYRMPVVSASSRRSSVRSRAVFHCQYPPV